MTLLRQGGQRQDGPDNGLLLAGGADTTAIDRERPEQPEECSDMTIRNGLSASDDQKGQAAVQRYYFNGRNSSATVSCSGTSGKKARRWQ